MSSSHSAIRNFTLTLLSVMLGAAPTWAGVPFVDEFVGGGIYKFAPSEPNSTSALLQGQTFVLKDSDASDGANLGDAIWEPLTDVLGTPLPGVTDPFTFTGGARRPGRTAANDVGATNYGRPEDLEIGTLANGNEVLY